MTIPRPRMAWEAPVWVRHRKEAQEDSRQAARLCRACDGCDELYRVQPTAIGSPPDSFRLREMASVPDSASVPSAERERGIEKTDELRRLKNARNRKFESISLQRRVLCEPDFLNRGAENIAERWPTLACKANIARARELIAASVAVTDPPAEHDDPDLDVSAVEILPGARHRCEALTAPDGRPGRIHRTARGLGLKARDGAAARLRE